MELTGKCKEDFEKWYADNVEFTGEVLYLEEFYILPPSMKYGVYVDFLDSVGIDIADFKAIRRDYYYSEIDIHGKNAQSVKHETRNEARTAAIEKANELFNT